MRKEGRRAALSQRKTHRIFVGSLAWGLFRLAVLWDVVTLPAAVLVHSFTTESPLSASRHRRTNERTPAAYWYPRRPWHRTPCKISNPAAKHESAVCSRARGEDEDNSDGDNGGTAGFVEGSVSVFSSAAVEDSQRAIQSYRRIVRVQRFARLPVWPAWNGLIIWVVQKVLGTDAAARLENAWTGRVCPNFFDNVDATSPFVMLVHHVHSFANYDLLRYIQSTFFPEGFPSHPHRGFVTLTYFLSGGFIHRDSTGCRQLYGVDDPTAPDDRYHGHHSQWLHTGAGVLHEEMFDNHKTLPWESTRHELYQIWINVPAVAKMTPPFTRLLGPDEAPVVAVLKNGSCQLVEKGRLHLDPSLVSKTTVLAGSYNGCESSAPIASRLCVYHVRLFPRSPSDSYADRPQWSVDLPDSFQTAFLYVRCGEVFDAASSATDDNSRTRVPVHTTAFFEASWGYHPTSHKIVLENRHPSEVADFMFLAGEPLREPVAAQGSMVMNSYEGINQAYSDYASGKFGRPWDSSLPDDEWRAHVQKYPSQYRIDA